MKTHLQSIALITALLSGINSSPVGACEIIRLFTGDRALAKTMMPPSDGYGGYEVFLLVEFQDLVWPAAGSGSKANLLAFLTPQRWGYDVHLPDGKRVGQVNIDVADPNLPKGVYEIHPKYGECLESDKLFLHKDKRGNFKTTYQGQVVGSVSNSFNEFTQY